MSLHSWVMTYLIPSVAPANPGPLAALILSKTEAFTSQRTGGVLNKIDEATAGAIATTIEAAAPTYAAVAMMDDATFIAFVAAGICGESRFDPRAINPNHQDARVGESDHDAFLHTDLGIGQFDVREIIELPEFAGLDDAAVLAKAEDLAFAIPHFCDLVSSLQAWAFAQPDDIINALPNADPRVLGCQAYNSGRSGALAMARGAVKPDWGYGMGWMQRCRDFTTTLRDS